MPALSNLVTSLKPRIKQCPDITLERAIIECTRKFCRESWYYQKTIYLSTFDQQNAYEFSLDTDDELVAIQAVTYNNFPLTSVRQQDYRSDSTGSPTLYQYEPPNYLLVAPTPTKDETNSLMVRMVLQITEDATEIPEAIYRAHKETIEAGVMAYCFAIPEEIWTNFTLAEYHERAFLAGIQEAKRMRHRGFISGSLSMRPRRFLV